jgi:glycosyltransferase involved in cell wall biosynthesis
MPRNHILIYEPSVGGHQMIYIHYLLDAMAKHVPDSHVSLLLGKAVADHASTRDVIDQFPDRVTVRIAPDVTEGNRLFAAIHPFYEYQWRNAEALSRALTEIGPANVDLVLLPYLETIGLLHLALRPRLFHGIPWITIAIMIQYHQRKLGLDMEFRFVDLVQGLFLRRVLSYRSLVCCGTVNPYLAGVLRHRKLVHCLDPATPFGPTPMEAARTAFGLRVETCVVVVFGVLDHRKCIDVLLEGAARVVPELDLTVLLAGPQRADDLAPILSGPAAVKLREHGRLIESNTFSVVGTDIDPLSVADISWVFRERRFVLGSSVMIRSAMFRVPVIARRWGVIGRQTEEFDCGIALASADPVEVANTLTLLARDSALRARLGANGARAFARNTPENFTRPIVEAINRTFAPPNHAT